MDIESRVLHVARVKKGLPTTQPGAIGTGQARAVGGNLPRKKGRNWRLTARNGSWLLTIIVAVVMVGGVALIVYDGVSGLEPYTVTRTGVIESLGNSGEGEWGQQTVLIIRLDHGSIIHVNAPATTVIRIGGKVLVSERLSRAFHTKRYALLKLLY